MSRVQRVCNSEWMKLGRFEVRAREDAVTTPHEEPAAELVKRCMFCGNTPPPGKAANKEHPISRMLFNGNPPLAAAAKRSEVLFFMSDPVRYQGFTSRVCAKCNQDNDQLESNAKPVLHLLRDGATSLSHRDAQCLLDWIDKVRHGVSIAHVMRCRAQGQDLGGLSIPHWVNSRIGGSDRILLITRGPASRTGLSVTPPDHPAYVIHPSFYQIRINGLLLTSISEGYLVHRMLGVMAENKKSYDQRHIGRNVSLPSWRLYWDKPKKQTALIRHGPSAMICQACWQHEDDEPDGAITTLQTRVHYMRGGVLTPLRFQPFGDPVVPARRLSEEEFVKERTRLFRLALNRSMGSHVAWCDDTAKMQAEVRKFMHNIPGHPHYTR